MEVITTDGIFELTLILRSLKRPLQLYIVHFFISLESYSITYSFDLSHKNIFKRKKNKNIVSALLESLSWNRNRKGTKQSLCNQAAFKQYKKRSCVWLKEEESQLDFFLSYHVTNWFNFFFISKPNFVTIEPENNAKKINSFLKN